jgi:uncharacterized protein YneF (UPF0154 family)
MADFTCLAMIVIALIGGIAIGLFIALPRD